MTWTAEQAKASTSQVVAFTNDVKAGSLLLACANTSETLPLNTPTDSLGNIWTQIRLVTAAQEVAWWYAISNGAGACAITFGSGHFQGFIIAEFSTDQGSISLDSENGSEKTGIGSGADVLVTDSITASQANSLAVSFIGSDTGGLADVLAGTGCVLDAQGPLTNSGADRVALEHKLIGAGSQTLTWSPTGGWEGPVLIAAFKAGEPPEEGPPFVIPFRQF